MSEELLPPAEELAKLTDSQTDTIIGAADRSNRREHSYAITGMVCGTMSFFGVLASFIYLIVQGHPNAAGVLLGTAVLAIVGQMIRSRLRL